VDPAGAILISVYIIVSWAAICKNQMDKIVGAAAPEDFVAELEELANAHHDLLEA
jgi:divalent metal cation (Fe/Co/Zn/Cd) transporter